MSESPTSRAVRSRGGSPEDLRRRREQMLLRQIFRLFRVMSDETTRRVVARGHDGLQSAHLRLLGNLDTEGTRLNALGRRMGVSRQAVSQMVDELKRLGRIERHPDPDDARAVIVQFTPTGRRMLADGIAAMTDIEAEYAAVIGKRALQRIKTDLALLLEAIDPAGGFGRD
jgi:DNA-binding MarR family transcriptional regulator